MFLRIFLTVLLGVLGAGAFAADNISCRVRDVGGVPRLTLNGKPVRARMLYVSPLYFQLASPIIRVAYDDADVETFVEIPALKEAVNDASIEFRAHKKFRGKIYSLEIVEQGSNRRVYALDAKGDSRVKTSRANAEFKSENGRAYMEVSNASPNGFGKIIFTGAKFEADKTYRINIHIRAEKKFNFNLYAAVGGEFFEPKPRSFAGVQTKIAKEGGCDFITFPVQAADFMPEDGKSFNTQNLKGALDEILAANPDAKILVRIRCYPPDWWINKYPQDAFRSADGKLFKKYKGAGSVFSERFRADSAKAIEAVIDFCESYCGDSVIGYHPGGAHSCEWFYPDVGAEDWIGYEESAQISWRKWLSKKYGTDKNLQAAWNDETATLATARVPPPKERMRAFCLIDPRTQQKLLDCNLFRQDAMVDTILHLAKTIRRKVPNKLSGAFYGYIIITDPKGAANPGHFGLARLLKSDAVDFLCGPVAYSNRDLGDGCMFPGSPETVVRSGKLWFAEDDIRTHRTPQTQSKVSKIGKELRTLGDTLKVLQRNLAQEAIRNCGNWYMDMAGMGWYAEPALFGLMRKFGALETDMINNPVPYAPEVAVIVDEYSACHGGANNTNNRTMSSAARTRTFITKLAAPYGSYLLDDYLFGKPISPKLSIFTVACALDKKRRDAIFAKTRDAGAVFVWNTGIIDTRARKIDLDGVFQATGFKVKFAEGDMGMLVKSTPEGLRAGLDRQWGTKEPTKPLLAPILRDGDKVLAAYPNGEPAIVLRGKHLFCGVGFLTPKLLDFMYKIAGVHRYSTRNVCVFASGAYISVTCTDGGDSPQDVDLNIPSNRDVYDALTGEKLGKAPNITLKMKLGDNRVLRLGRGNADFK